MKSDAYAVSRMKPRYHARKKIVHGITNLRRRWTSSWNSGDRSIASQSIAGWARSNGSAMTSLLLRQGSAGVVPADRGDFVPDRSRVVRFDERRLTHDERRPLARRPRQVRVRSAAREGVGWTSSWGFCWDWCW